MDDSDSYESAKTEAYNNKDPSLLKRRENTESLQLYILLLGRSTDQ